MFVFLAHEYSCGLQVGRDFTAPDSAQLSVKEGEHVFVKKKDPFATRALRVWQSHDSGQP
jgi:hypothetical protein